MSDFSEFLSPLIKTESYNVIPLAGDASTRRYYRIVADKKSWVLMEWEPFQQISDFPFLSVQKYFDENGIRVPKVHEYSKDTGLFLLEDLGDLTLERRFWEFQNQEVVLPFYEKTLDQLIKIHSLYFDDSSERVCTAYHNEFSVEKLVWELNYAKKFLLKGLLEIDLTESQEKSLEAEYIELCEKLYQSPQVICHRDFHSRNVMLSYNDTCIIDFQDARLGPPAYDLVSLFQDSYVNLNQSSVNHLMDYYKKNFAHYKALNLSEDEWDQYIHLQTIQRCFKACGSFASFKVTRDDNRYLHYIAPTLKVVIERWQEWNPKSETAALLSEHQERWEDL